MKFASILALAALVLTSCAGPAETGRNAAGIGEKRTSASERNRIHAAVWRLKGMTIAGENVPLIDNSEISISIDPYGKFSGLATINLFFGTLQFHDDGTIGWPPPFGSTKMAGPQNMMEQEDRFLNALPLAEFLYFRGGKLWMESSDGSAVLVFGEKVD